MSEDTEWSEGKRFTLFHDDPAPRKTILPTWSVILAVVFGVAMVFGAVKVNAEPMVQAIVNGGAVVITIHRESCARKDVVENLPNRATWQEGVKTFEGCAGAQPDAGIAMFWFEDKTVGAVPLNLFKKVVGA